MAKVNHVFKSAILCMADFRKLGCCGFVCVRVCGLHRTPIILHINPIFLTPVKLCDWSTRFMRVTAAYNGSL